VPFGDLEADDDLDNVGSYQSLKEEMMKIF